MLIHKNETSVLLTMSVNFFFFGFDATEPTLLVYQLDE